MVLLMSLSVAGLSFLRSVRQSVTSFCGVPSNSQDRSSPRFLGMDERGREVLSYMDGEVPIEPHPEWALIHIAGGFVRIEIDDGASIVQAGGASDQMSFYFTPKPDTTSQTDTLWTVIQWDETRAGVP